MNSKRTLSLLGLAAGLFALNMPAIAQQPAAAAKRVDFGKMEYEAKCAACHGRTGKGDGPTRPYLSKSPTDLTTLAKANGGILPVARMYDTITGAKDMPVHGSRDMPVWGTAYKLDAGEHFVDAPYDPESYVRGRVLTLIEYINRLQAK